MPKRTLLAMIDGLRFLGALVLLLGAVSAVVLALLALFIVALTHGH